MIDCDSSGDLPRITIRAQRYRRRTWFHQCVPVGTADLRGRAAEDCVESDVVWRLSAGDGVGAEVEGTAGATVEWCVRVGSVQKVAEDW
jgi:hypothetical protein